MKYAPLLIAALMLTCCGGGDNATAPPPVPPKKSRLAAFDAQGLDTGLDLPDFTRYWTLAEKRNGNSYPVKASVTDESVIALRLDSEGKFAVRGDKWVNESLPTIARKLDELGRKFWNSEREASAAAIILFSDSDAPYRPLLQLCRELVNLQVRNLWLVTRDTRDASTRLLPLKIDTDQLFREWYYLPPEESAATLVMDKSGIRYRTGDVAVDFETWPDELEPAQVKALAGATRVQFDLEATADMARFASAANLAAPVGFVDVEPFWPVLVEAAGDEPVVAKRDLLDFTDELGVAADLNLPTLSEYWRAVAASERLPAPVRVDADAPVLSLRVATDGLLSTRAPGEPEWTSHADDLGFIQALQRNAGEIDFDTGASTLQLVMAMDRNANWEQFLGVMEMMISVGCHRLFVVTNDAVGPTLRLLDLSLPIGQGLEDAKVASVDLQREGMVADAKYTVEFTFDGETHEYTGSRFASSLTVWTGQRKSDPDVLLLRLPRDEPFETLFTVLNATAWLGMKGIRFGG